MSVGESMKVALRGLTANKLRSSLTMLGIIIGVGAVISLLSVGEGAQAEITGQIQSIGSNLIFVFSGTFEEPGGAGHRPVVKRTNPLTMEDAEALSAAGGCCPSILAVAPEVQTGAEITFESQSVYLTVSGTSPEYEYVRNFYPEIGEFFTDSDVDTLARVVVIGYSVAEKLFEDMDPIDQTVRINRIPFRVVAVLEEKGGGAFGGGPGDSIAIIPITTAQVRLLGTKATSTTRGRKVEVINVSAVDEDSVEAAMDEISVVLRERHGIQFEDDDFTIASQKDILSMLDEIMNILTIFLGSVAAISLLVGGIGIMNIMLVSVTERTREIGIRKAVGARRSDILLQFLIEAVVLSVLGGIIGIGLGAGVSAIVNSLGAFTTRITVGAVSLAVGFSIVVGLFFGIYPATRASRLSPIDALRYE